MASEFHFSCGVCAMQFKSVKEVAGHVLTAHKSERESSDPMTYVQTVFTPMDLKLLTECTAIATVTIAQVAGLGTSPNSARAYIKALTSLLQHPEELTNLTNKLTMMIFNDQIDVNRKG